MPRSGACGGAPLFSRLQPEEPMKALVCALLMIPVLVRADDITEIDGTVITGKITRTDAVGLIVMTDSGVSHIKFKDLPKEIQQKYGYNPVKAAEYQTAALAESIASQ